MFRFVLLFLLVCKVSLTSYADDYNLDDIKDLKPKVLLHSFLDSNFKIFIGRSSDGNHYVIMNKDGQLTAPEQEQHSMVYYDGGSMNLSFLNGEKLIIPSEAVVNNYLEMSIGPRFLPVDKAPEPMTRMTLSREKIVSAGFGRFLAEEEEAVAPTRESLDYTILSQPIYMSIVSVDLEDIEYDTSKAIEKKYDIESGDTEIRYAETRGALNIFGPARRVFLVAQGAEERWRSSLPENTHSTIETFNPKAISTEPSSLVVNPQYVYETIRLLKKKDLSLEERVKKIVHLNKGVHAQKLSELSKRQKKELLGIVYSLLGELEVYYQNLHGLAAYETAVTDQVDDGSYKGVGSARNYKKTRQHAIYQAHLEPIRNLAFELFDVIHKVGTRNAIEALIHAVSAFDGVAWPILLGKINGSEKTYFEHWLQTSTEELNVVELLPEKADFDALQDLNISASMRSGGVFEKLRLSADLATFYRDNRFTLVRHLSEPMKPNMRTQLGLPGDPTRLKVAIIQYIMDADKVSLKSSEWARNAQIFRRMRDGHFTDEAVIEYMNTGKISRETFEELKKNENFPPILRERPEDAMSILESRYEQATREGKYEVWGDERLHKFISYLTFPDLFLGLQLDEFSEIKYRKNVMELLIELLELSPDLIQNDATFVFLLDAALVMADKVDATEEFAELRAISNQLRKTVNHRMIDGLNKVSWQDGSADFCTQLLTP